MPSRSAWCLWMPFEPSTLSRQQTAGQAVKTNLLWVQRKVISILPRACESAQNLAEFSLCPSKHCYKTLIHPYWSPECLWISYLFVISGQPVKPTVRSSCSPVSVASLWLQPGSVRQKPLTGQGLSQTSREFSPLDKHLPPFLHVGNQGLTRTGWVRQHPALAWWLKGHPRGECPPDQAQGSPGCADLCPPPLGKQLEFHRQLCSRLMGLLFL